LIGERSAKAGGTQLGSGGNGGSPSASGRGNPKVDARGRSGCGGAGDAGGVTAKAAGQEASGMGRIERAWVWLRESLARYRAAIGERDEAVAL